MSSQANAPTAHEEDNWVEIASESFDAYFPGGNWRVQDHGSDTCSLCWDDATYYDGVAYRAYSDLWAAWPPRGGASGYTPYTNNHYANDMDTRMIYGPFDLSDAVYAETDFYLWRETEPGYDYLAFEISLDGVNFQELDRWEGDVRAWQYRLVLYDDYVGYANVWIAFRFVSDYSTTYQGPWVDDIGIWKYVPGEVRFRVPSVTITAVAVVCQRAG